MRQPCARFSSELFLPFRSWHSTLGAWPASPAGGRQPGTRPAARVMQPPHVQLQPQPQPQPEQEPVSPLPSQQRHAIGSGPKLFVFVFVLFLFLRGCKVKLAQNRSAACWLWSLMSWPSSLPFSFRKQSCSTVTRSPLLPPPPLPSSPSCTPSFLSFS